MYLWDARIRFSEADENGRLKLTSLVDYFQDCSTSQSEDVGFGVKRLLEMRRVWVVNSWQIDIERLPRFGERVSVGTITYDIHGFIGMRNFFMTTDAGERLAAANTVWSYLDLDTGEVVRVPAEMSEAYGIDEKLDMEYLSRKIPFAATADTEKRPAIRVMPENLDSNGHVNNGQYIRLAMNAAYGGEQPGVSRLRAEYKKQTHLGDVLYPEINTDRETGIRTIALKDEEGSLCCTVEITP